MSIASSDAEIAFVGVFFVFFFVFLDGQNMHWSVYFCCICFGNFLYYLVSVCFFVCFVCFCIVFVFFCILLYYLAIVFFLYVLYCVCMFYIYICFIFFKCFLYLLPA